MMSLQRIPAHWFERAGTAMAAVAWIAISLQLHAEWLRHGPSSLSIGNLLGYLAVYVFWFLYGLRFARTAVWVGNLVAAVLQFALLMMAQHHG
jgi:hypothetical protein